MVPSKANPHKKSKIFDNAVLVLCIPTEPWVLAVSSDNSAMLAASAETTLEWR